MKKQTNNAQRFAIGAFLAAAIGYLAGILTAPKSGKETRQDIKDNTTQAVSEAEKQLKVLHTEITDLAKQVKGRGSEMSGKAKEEFDDIVAKANDARQKVREVISGVHEGEAEDKELQKAIHDAQKAVKHLTNYLKK